MQYPSLLSLVRNSICHDHDDKTHYANGVKLSIALAYRLAILHVASSILPSIGADAWEDEEGVDGLWETRPV